MEAVIRLGRLAGYWSARACPALRADSLCTRNPTASCLGSAGSRGTESQPFQRDRDFGGQLPQISNQLPTANCGSTTARAMRLLSWRRSQPAEMYVWGLPRDVAAVEL